MPDFPSIPDRFRVLLVNTALPHLRPRRTRDPFRSLVRFVNRGNMFALRQKLPDSSHGVPEAWHLLARRLRGAITTGSALLPARWSGAPVPDAEAWPPVVQWAAERGEFWPVFVLAWAAAADVYEPDEYEQESAHRTEQWHAEKNMKRFTDAPDEHPSDGYRDRGRYALRDELDRFRP